MKVKEKCNMLNHVTSVHEGRKNSERADHKQADNYRGQNAMENVSNFFPTPFL